jgi:sialate O-acetylesterase
MAVSSDVGNRHDVHPTNKKTVGERLARWALNQVYEVDLVPSGPLPLKAEYREGRVVVRFQHGKTLTTSDGKVLRGFSFDGENETDARIEGNIVVIPVAKKPARVYYGWKPYTDANLVNEENLPASGFCIGVE